MTAIRRVIVGFDEAGRSAVVADGGPGASVTRPNGAVVAEIWRQERLPVDRGTLRGSEYRPGSMEPLPPSDGMSVRIFTLPPDRHDAHEVSEQDLAGAFGAHNVTIGTAGQPLARTPSLYVAAVLSGRAYLVLETSEVLLEAGDSFVLPGALHAWSNPFDETAVMLATVTRLTDQASDDG